MTTNRRSLLGQTALGFALLAVAAGAAGVTGVTGTRALAGLVEVNGMRRDDGTPPTAIRGFAISIDDSGVVVREHEARPFDSDRGIYDVGVTPGPKDFISEHSRWDLWEGPDFDHRGKFAGVSSGEVFFFDSRDGSDRPAAEAVPLPPAFWTGLPMLGAVIAWQAARRKRRVT